MSLDLTDRVIGYLEEHRQDMIDLLAALVNIDTGTGQAQGLNEVATILERELAASGMAASRVAAPAGDHVLARRLPTDGVHGPRSLVIGHMDTVFPPGTARERPFRIDDAGRAWGPGVEDMKSGLVAAVFAARALTELGLWPGHPVTFFFNSDEEIRSPSSSEVFAREGAVADECYVLEGARDDGSVVTARKGSARFQLSVVGQPSHSGANHPAGRSAIKALAHKVLALEALTDYEAGTTVNVGLVRGGLSFNTVPGKAWCDVDIRVLTPDDGERVVKAIREIADREDIPGTRTTLTGGITRPPMVRTRETVQLFEAMRHIAASLGRDLTESLTGGGSDGCLTAAAGAPTLDGLGPMGGGAHTDGEYIWLESLVPCAAMLAAALATGPHARRGR